MRPAFQRHSNLFLLSIATSVARSMHLTLLACLELESSPTDPGDRCDTADAGCKRAWKAFWISCRTNCAAHPARPAVTAGDQGGKVITSTVWRVPLAEPRVKLHMLNFSEYHAQSASMVLNWLGLHTGRWFLSPQPARSLACSSLRAECSRCLLDRTALQINGIVSPARSTDSS